MTQEKIKAIIAKVETASTWYGLSAEKLKAKENWKMYHEVYERTIKEIEVMLND